MEKKTIRDLDVLGKKVLLRVDFNVPLKNGVIEDDNRIIEAVPTIQFLLNGGAKLIVVSHLGRPDGKVMPEYSLAPAAARLAQLLGKQVKLSPEVVGNETTKMGMCLCFKIFFICQTKKKSHQCFVKNLPALQTFM